MDPFSTVRASGLLADKLKPCHVANPPRFIRAVGMERSPGLLNIVSLGPAALDVLVLELPSMLDKTGPGIHQVLSISWTTFVLSLPVE